VGQQAKRLKIAVSDGSDRRIEALIVDLGQRLTGQIGALQADLYNDKVRAVNRLQAGNWRSLRQSVRVRRPDDPDLAIGAVCTCLPRTAGLRSVRLLLWASPLAASSPTAWTSCTT
jgi:hypothetical protein